MNEKDDAKKFLGFQFMELYNEKNVAVSSQLPKLGPSFCRAFRSLCTFDIRIFPRNECLYWDATSAWIYMVLSFHCRYFIACAGRGNKIGTW